MTPLARLRKKAQEWGGDLVEVSEDDFNELFGYMKSAVVHPPKPGYVKAPFRSRPPFGVNYKERRVYYTPNVAPADLIHEMGHVFATRRSPDKPCAEFNFFGWEHALARKFGLFREWEKSNGLYKVTNELFYRELWPKDRKALLAKTLKAAQKRGLVSPNGVPLSIR